MPAAQPFDFYWNLDYAKEDKTRNSIEIWYDAADQWLQVSLAHQQYGVVATVAPGQTVVEVLTFNASGAAAAKSFYIVVYGASDSG